MLTPCQCLFLERKTPPGVLLSSAPLSLPHLWRKPSCYSAAYKKAGNCLQTRCNNNLQGFTALFQPICQKMSTWVYRPEVNIKAIRTGKRAWEGSLGFGKFKRQNWQEWVGRVFGK